MAQITMTLDQIAKRLADDVQFRNHFYKAAYHGQATPKSLRLVIWDYMAALMPGEDRRTISERDRLVHYFKDIIIDRKLSYQLEEILPLPEQKETTDMSHQKIIETKTYVNGADAANMTDEQIFSAIANVEAEINHLNGVQNKPQKLEAKIAAMQEDIKALVAFVDGRN